MVYSPSGVPGGIATGALATVANALTVIVKHFGWQGNVGIGLPAVSVGTDSESVNETFDSVDMDAAIDQSFRETDIYAMEEGVAAKKLAERERTFLLKYYYYSKVSPSKALRARAAGGPTG